MTVTAGSESNVSHVTLPLTHARMVTRGMLGSIWGSVLGILISFMLKTGLVLINVKAEWYRGVLGIIMIAAVIINTNIRRQR